MAKKIYVKHVIIFSDSEDSLCEASDAAVNISRQCGNTTAWGEDYAGEKQAVEEYQGSLDDFFGGPVELEGAPE